MKLANAVRIGDMCNAPALLDEARGAAKMSQAEVEKDLRRRMREAGVKPKPEAKSRNTLPLIGRWRILDNLRRSLVAPSLFLWLVASCLIFPGSAFGWGLFVLLTIAFPVHLHIATGLLIHPRGIPWTSHFWSIWGDFRTNMAQVALAFVMLPHQAYLMCDAIVRTVYRQLISRKQLLEWISAAEAERTSRQDLGAFFSFMIAAPVLTLLAVIGTVVFRPAAMWLLSLPALTWSLSPVIA